MQRFAVGVFILVAFVSVRAEGPTKPSEEEAKVLDMTNKERKKRDLQPLTWSAALSKVARAHSGNMSSQGKMDHKLDGKGPFDRLNDAGYKFMNAGENIGAGSGAQPSVIMKAWMESKAHRENILLPEFTEIGIGIVRAKNGDIYYTQVFARPRK